MDELIATDSNADVRRTWRNRREEDEIAWLEPLWIDLLALPKLLADLARQRQPVLLVNVLNETAAIES